MVRRRSFHSGALTAGPCEGAAPACPARRRSYFPACKNPVARVEGVSRRTGSSLASSRALVALMARNHEPSRLHRVCGVRFASTNPVGSGRCVQSDSAALRGDREFTRDHVQSLAVRVGMLRLCVPGGLEDEERLLAQSIHGVTTWLEAPFSWKSSDVSGHAKVCGVPSRGKQERAFPSGERNARGKRKQART